MLNDIPTEDPGHDGSGSPSADDAAAYKSGIDINILIDRVQLYLNKLSLFFASRGFTISATKTVVVLFTRCPRLVDAAPPLSINGHSLNYVTTVKVLGIYFYSRLT